MNNRELENRLIDFAVRIVEISEKMSGSFASSHLAGQMLRSGTSPALNYGEALGAESRRDFIHKIKVVLKELRETYNCLRIIHHSSLYRVEDEILGALKENNELISIFVKTVTSAQKNVTT